MLGLTPVLDPLGFLDRCRDGRPLHKTCYTVRRERGAGDLSVGSGRNPDLGVVGKGIPWRHDANDGVGLAVEDQQLIKFVPLAQSPTPERMADDGHALESGGLRIGERSADHRGRPQRLEEAGRHGRRADAFGAVLCAHVQPAGRVDTDTVERRALFHLARGGDPHLAEPHRPVRDLDDPFRLWIRQRFEQHRISHAEERRVGADAKGEGQHRHRREARTPAEGSERETKVVQHRHAIIRPQQTLIAF